MIQKEKQLFLNDYYLPGMLRAVTYRAPVDCGSVESVSFPSDIDSKCFVIKSCDIPGKKHVSIFGNRIPLLSDNSINYTGEPLFILAGDDEQTCKSVMGSIKLSITETRPCGFDSAVISEDQVVYQKLFSTGQRKERNVSVKDPEQKPSAEDSEKSDTIIVTDSFNAGEYHSRYCEPFGAIAHPVKNEMIVYTVSQWPNHVRKTVAEALDTSQKNVKIFNTAISSPLEGRIWYPSLVSAQAAVAAKISGRPVKLMFSRHETFSYTPRQHPFRVFYKTFVTGSGKLDRMEINLDIDGGAYPILLDGMFEKAFLTAAGLYDCNDISLFLRIVKTSKPPMSFISSFNFSQFLISIEKHVSNIAKTLRTSQVEWRKENILGKGARRQPLSDLIENDYRNLSTHRSRAVSILEKAASFSDFERKYSSYELLRLNRDKNAGRVTHGIGVSLGFYSNRIPLKTMEKEKLSLRMLLDSKSNLNIYTTTVPDGLNNYDIWKNSASEMLGIPTESIFIIPHQTDIAPVSAAYPFSRGLGGFTELLKKSCQSLQKKRFRQPLPIEITSSISLNTIGKDDLSWGAAVVELSFDHYTYEITIREIWCCFDCGQILHKEIIDKSVYSGVIDSLNWISGSEYMSMEKNRFIQNDSTWQFFNIPINTHYTNELKNSKPLLVGDLPLSLIPGAYFGALVQAAGKDIDTSPVTLEKIHQLINQDRNK